MLGLRFPVTKTEALLFHGPCRSLPRQAYVCIQGVEVAEEKDKISEPQTGWQMENRGPFLPVGPET